MIFSKWLKKLSDFMFEEIPEEEEKKVDPMPAMERQYHRRAKNIHTKVKHQYPNQKSFNFPAIPDNPRESQIHSKTPEPVKQKRNEKREVKKGEFYRASQQTDRPKQQTKKPFKPTQVPSPIYGFHCRDEQAASSDVTDVPTYVRKQSSDKNEPINKPVPTVTREETKVMPTEDRQGQKKEPIEPVQKVEQKEIVHQTMEPDNNRYQKKMGPAQKDTVPKQYRKKRNEMKKQSNETPTPVPFNVMMSANDKHKQQQKNEQRERTKSFFKSVIPHISGEMKQPVPYYLLDDFSKQNGPDEEWISEQRELLEMTLSHFHVNANVVHATQGPAVTRFEVQPEMGVKVSKVKNLSDDLKLNMAASDIRIEAPIPGKNTIGIEIPNKKPTMVGLQEIITSKTFIESSDTLTIGLGLTIEGSPLITTIQKMPHGLIAGATGSGKSVCINTILLSLIYKASYQDVKFMLIDPKMVELAPYNGIPHLVSPVITDVKAATAALKWAVNEMEKRYEQFVQAGVRNIERYNQKVLERQQPAEKMPFLIIVIDELADLMMMAPHDVEDSISRIAQKARACGIHLLLATQRPSVDVITGLIKANIPTRIAFSVSSQVDSRTIIDTSGAEKLLGKGDMLFVENGKGKSVRLQGAFVSDDEIERVTKYARSIAEPEYLFEQEQLLENWNVDDAEDELLEVAIDFVVNQNSASTSQLQRHFKIGYNRAARLMDSMEQKGIISGQNGSKPRDVLVKATE